MQAKGKVMALEEAFSLRPTRKGGLNGSRPGIGRVVAGWLAAVLCLPVLASAHATGENYVWLNVETDHLQGRFELKLTDLERHFQLDIPEDPEAARSVVRGSADRIQEYLRSRYALAIEGRDLPYEFTGVDVVDTQSELGGFAQYFYRTAEVAPPDRLEVRNEVLLDTDRFHRSLLCIQYDRRLDREYGEEFTALVFGSSKSEQVLDFTDVRGLLRVRDFVWQGVIHIWFGIDHVLFLVALLITAVLVLRPKPDATAADWQPVGGFREALWNVVKIVTLFTVAHSITLSLAALDIVRLPSRFVESVIAFSIVLIALNNLFPRLRERSWIVIFFFGLFHGLGFASVMGDLPFRMNNLVQVVLAFNIGVELGQLAIVLAIFPVIYLLRESRMYRPAVLVGGSLAICVVATYWLVTRAFGLA